MDNAREEAPGVTITHARVERARLLVSLSDATVRAIAVASIPELATATPDQLARLESSPGDISWPALGVRLGLDSLWRLPITSLPSDARDLPLTKP